MTSYIHTKPSSYNGAGKVNYSYENFRSLEYDYGGTNSTSNQAERDRPYHSRSYDVAEANGRTEHSLESQTPKENCAPTLLSLKMSRATEEEIDLEEEYFWKNSGITEIVWRNYMSKNAHRKTALWVMPTAEAKYREGYLEVLIIMLRMELLQYRRKKRSGTLPMLPEGVAAQERHQPVSQESQLQVYKTPAPDAQKVIPLQSPAEEPHSSKQWKTAENEMPRDEHLATKSPRHNHYKAEGTAFATPKNEREPTLVVKEAPMGNSVPHNTTVKESTRVDSLGGESISVKERDPEHKAYARNESDNKGSHTLPIVTKLQTSIQERRQEAREEPNNILKETREPNSRNKIESAVISISKGEERRLESASQEVNKQEREAPAQEKISSKQHEPPAIKECHSTLLKEKKQEHRSSHSTDEKISQAVETTSPSDGRHIPPTVAEQLQHLKLQLGEQDRRANSLQEPLETKPVPIIRQAGTLIINDGQTIPAVRIIKENTKVREDKYLALEVQDLKQTNHEGCSWQWGNEETRPHNSHREKANNGPIGPIITKRHHETMSKDNTGVKESRQEVKNLEDRGSSTQDNPLLEENKPPPRAGEKMFNISNRVIEPLTTELKCHVATLQEVGVMEQLELLPNIMTSPTDRQHILPTAEDKQNRWMDYMSKFKIDIPHIKGELNKVADCLSCYYENDTSTDAQHYDEYIQANAHIDPSGEDLPNDRSHKVVERCVEISAMREGSMILQENIKERPVVGQGNLDVKIMEQLEPLNNNKQHNRSEGQDPCCCATREIDSVKPGEKKIEGDDEQQTLLIMREKRYKTTLEGPKIPCENEEECPVVKQGNKNKKTREQHEQPAKEVRRSIETSQEGEDRDGNPLQWLSEERQLCIEQHEELLNGDGRISSSTKENQNTETDRSRNGTEVLNLQENTPKKVKGTSGGNRRVNRLDTCSNQEVLDLQSISDTRIPGNQRSRRRPGSGEVTVTTKDNSRTKDLVTREVLLGMSRQDRDNTQSCLDRREKPPERSGRNNGGDEWQTQFISEKQHHTKMSYNEQTEVVHLHKNNPPKGKTPSGWTKQAKRFEERHKSFTMEVYDLRTNANMSTMKGRTLHRYTESEKKPIVGWDEYRIGGDEHTSTLTRRPQPKDWKTEVRGLTTRETLSHTNEHPSGEQKCTTAPTRVSATCKTSPYTTQRITEERRRAESSVMYWMMPETPPRTVEYYMEGQGRIMAPMSEVQSSGWQEVKRHQYEQTGMNETPHGESTTHSTLSWVPQRTPKVDWRQDGVKHCRSLIDEEPSKAWTTLEALTWTTEHSTEGLGCTVAPVKESGTCKTSPITQNRPIEGYGCIIAPSKGLATRRTSPISQIHPIEKHGHTTLPRGKLTTDNPSPTMVVCPIEEYEHITVLGRRPVRHRTSPPGVQRVTIVRPNIEWSRDDIIHHPNKETHFANVKLSKQGTTLEASPQTKQPKHGCTATPIEDLATCKTSPIIYIRPKEEYEYIIVLGRELTTDNPSPTMVVRPIEEYEHVTVLGRRPAMHRTSPSAVRVPTIGTIVERGQDSVERRIDQRKSPADKKNISRQRTTSKVTSPQLKVKEDLPFIQGPARLRTCKHIYRGHRTCTFHLKRKHLLLRRKRRDCGAAHPSKRKAKSGAMLDAANQNVGTLCPTGYLENRGAASSMPPPEVNMKTEEGILNGTYQVYQRAPSSHPHPLASETKSSQFPSRSNVHRRCSKRRKCGAKLRSRRKGRAGATTDTVAKVVGTVSPTQILQIKGTTGVRKGGEEDILNLTYHVYQRASSSHPQIPTSGLECSHPPSRRSNVNRRCKNRRECGAKLRSNHRESRDGVTIDTVDRVVGTMCPTNCLQDKGTAFSMPPPGVSKIGEERKRETTYIVSQRAPSSQIQPLTSGLERSHYLPSRDCNVHRRCRTTSLRVSNSRPQPLTSGLERSRYHPSGNSNVHRRCRTTHQRASNSHPNHYTPDLEQGNHPSKRTRGNAYRRYIERSRYQPSEDRNVHRRCRTTHRRASSSHPQPYTTDTERETHRMRTRNNADRRYTERRTRGTKPRSVVANVVVVVRDVGTVCPTMNLKEKRTAHIVPSHGISEMNGKGYHSPLQDSKASIKLAPSTLQPALDVEQDVGRIYPTTNLEGRAAYTPLQEISKRVNEKLHSPRPGSIELAPTTPRPTLVDGQKAETLARNVVARTKAGRSHRCQRYILSLINKRGRETGHVRLNKRAYKSNLDLYKAVCMARTRSHGYRREWRNIPSL